MYISRRYQRPDLIAKLRIEDEARWYSGSIARGTSQGFSGSTVIGYINNTGLPSEVVL